LRQNSTLQSSNRSINANILLLAPAVNEEKDQTDDDKDSDSRERADPKRALFFIDGGYNLLGSASIFFNGAKVVCHLLVPQLRSHPREQFVGIKRQR
jgi:hypothetical protein